MAKETILTISILCSGRLETKKCLDSLKTLREKISCELILVDTGCDAEMKKLLYAYTEKVISFRWCNDFSKARNAGLEKAAGEWFLYLDDDESFIDTEAIEKFFLSGEYKQYGYAVYTVRNFFDEEKAEYQDTAVARMYSLKEGGMFYGTIHEDFEPKIRPVKILPSIAEHTGYVFITPKDKKKHAARNISLLEKAVVAKNVNEKSLIRLRAHLAHEYSVLKDYKKLLAFCKETLSQFAEKEETEINRHRGCFYCGEIQAQILLKKEEAAFCSYEKAIADKRNTGYCIAYLMTQGAELFWNKGEKEKAEECCKRYLELWEHYREKPEKLFQEQTFFVITAFYEETKNRIYSHQICLDLKKGDTSSLKQYFDAFGWEKEVVCMTKEFMPHLVKAMAQLPYEEIFVHAADVLANKPGMDNFWEEAGKIEKEEELKRFIKIFSEITGDAAAHAAEKMKERLDAKREIRLLADNIKAQIPILLSKGMKQEALQIVKQLKNLTPDDKELEELKRKCGM